MKLYNTLSRQVEELRPIEGKKVKLYTCGLTVYDQPHIGNWVAYIYWDVLVRALKLMGYDVVRTQNYTDVGHLVSDDDSGEDKMEKGAKREGLTAWDIADKYIKIAEHEGYGLLGLTKPDYLVRATDYISQQIAFVQELEKRGYTYKIENEGIYFDTSKLADYGKLARLDIKGLQAGARVAVAGKRSITDFALWKFSPEDAKRDMEWESPWGKGFPGWHLECSVIARETLGDEIDIHTGGVDHVPVHHTNEIAQTEALTGKPFARIWLHNNHLKVEGGKMAKSIGNVYTLSDITARGFDVAAFKLMILGKHYRTEGNFTWENLQAAQNRLKALRAMADLRFQPVQLAGEQQTLLFKEVRRSIETAITDDLNTPQVLEKISVLETTLAETLVNSESINEFGALLHFLDELLGMKLCESEDISEQQRRWLVEREQTRQTKDWSKADELRAQLEKQGVGVRDTAHGQIWFRL